MVCMVAAAVSNTILRRIAMVPMERYPLFLTILQTFNYVIVYGIILAFRIEHNHDTSNANDRDRPVTKEMLQIRKMPFLWIGLWDSLGDLLGNSAIGKLPGYQPPLLAKLNIVFTALFSRALLGERYNQQQIFSMGVVICGSIVTLIPLVWDAILTSNSGSNGEDDGIGDDNSSNPLSSLFYVAVYISSVAPTALGFVLKEQVFREYERSFDLDIFVVNTYTAIGGLLCQALFFVPLAGLSGVPYSEISQYMGKGYHCFTNDFHNDSIEYDDACRGSPLAPVLYLAVNILYNIYFLMSIKHGGTLLTFITNTVTFPLSTLLFTCGIAWPLLGSSSRLNGWIVVGLLVEITGILWYYSEKTNTNLFFYFSHIISSYIESKTYDEKNTNDHENMYLLGDTEEKVGKKKSTME